MFKTTGSSTFIDHRAFFKWSYKIDTEIQSIRVHHHEVVTMRERARSEIVKSDIEETKQEIHVDNKRDCGRRIAPEKDLLSVSLVLKISS
ncbi:hypothetical protein Bca52824_000112 [Brassica carinata]|uniref:Uncharacterized protein n=1 Tax=Brassica carinata TaxID=52824 RepID=A0A8X8BCH2_BRACI|nr:hypothetical protein Bca52824_000112 [Brassica carinata]